MNILARLAGSIAGSIPGPLYQLLPGRTEVLITFPERPPAAVRLGVASVESFLEHLGRVRMDLDPPVPEKYQAGMCVAHLDTVIVVSAETITGDVILNVRDRRYGWLRYLISRDRAREIGAAILQQVEKLPPEMSGRA